MIDSGGCSCCINENVLNVGWTIQLVVAVYTFLFCCYKVSRHVYLQANKRFGFTSKEGGTGSRLPQNFQKKSHLQVINNKVRPSNPGVLADDNNDTTVAVSVGTEASITHTRRASITQQARRASNVGNRSQGKEQGASTVSRRLGRFFETMHSLLLDSRKLKTVIDNMSHVAFCHSLSGLAAISLIVNSCLRLFKEERPYIGYDLGVSITHALAWSFTYTYASAISWNIFDGFIQSSFQKHKYLKIRRRGLRVSGLLCSAAYTAKSFLIIPCFFPGKDPIIKQIMLIAYMAVGLSVLVVAIFGVRLHVKLLVRRITKVLSEPTASVPGLTNTAVTLTVVTVKSTTKVKEATKAEKLELNKVSDLHEEKGEKSKLNTHYENTIKFLYNLQLWVAIVCGGTILAHIVIAAVAMHYFPYLFLIINLAFTVAVMVCNHLLK
jgi:hypothetical protein